MPSSRLWSSHLCGGFALFDAGEPIDAVTGSASVCDSSCRRRHWAVITALARRLTPHVVRVGLQCHDGKDGFRVPPVATAWVAPSCGVI
jgi:hypothetical protein